MNSRPQITDSDMPGLYQAANRASLDAQGWYYSGLISYLGLLVIASAISFASGTSPTCAMASAVLFLVTLAILIALRIKRPDDTWYNGRAVAESVKTRAWRWMMRAEPYVDCDKLDVVSKLFINDLKAILTQNRSFSLAVTKDAYLCAPITDAMRAIRAMSIQDRLDVYMSDRIQDQANWYARKSIFNKKRAQRWFCGSVLLHGCAIVMLLFRVQDPTLNLPIGVVATAASAVLTWLQAKKHNELASSYSLTAHEIVLIKGEGLSIDSNDTLSDFVVNTETAFSREHTQWVARKNK
jgi:hypothetical protein